MKKNTKLTIFVVTLCSVFWAASVHAQGLLNSGSNVKSVICGIIGIFNSLIPLLIGAAVVVFLYGILVFIAKASVGNAEGRAEGIKFMIYGIIGIAVMVSVWGLVAFVTTTLGVTGALPQFNTSSAGQGCPSGWQNLYGIFG